MSIKRHKRVTTPPIEVLLASEDARLRNISATGALVHTDTKHLVGRERQMMLSLSDMLIGPLNVQVVRVEFLPPRAQLAGDPRKYGVAVTFAAELTGLEKQAIEDLCGPAFTGKE